MGNFDHNTFRNNIIVDYGFNNHNPPVSYSMNIGAGEICDATCQNWMSTSIWDHNIFFQDDGNNGASVISAVTQSYACSTAGTVTSMTGCINADPKFTAASIAFWDAVLSFNFRLQSASPAVQAGSSTGALTYDILGSAFGRPPSIGAYEYGTFSPSPPSPNPPGSLPVPQVSFGDVPINETLTVANASAFAGYTINWTFTPVSILANNAVQSRASSANTIAASGSSVQPLNAGLSIGSYQVTVTVQNGSSNPPTASGQITFVSANLSGVRVYPNPWRSDKHSGKPVTFANLPVGADVKIFTVSGHKAREFDNVSGSVNWDLTNDSGDKVASGIYVYLITDGQGNKIKGKLAVIR